MPLIIDDEHCANWQRLCSSARRYLIAFLGAPDSPCVTSWPTIRGAASMPSNFSVDLGRGGHGLRVAFPLLERRVVGIEGSGPATVRIRCRGVHEGVFYGFLGPTGRCVEFDEVHSLVIEADVLVVDVVEIDLARIVRQIAGAGGEGRVQ